ncbi:MAG: hemolysin III family protein [Kiritimatiellae bacterium]|jgi:hemolysin III|nr:hemolysin III family protein [Kiritimatiellia bacterium]
MSDIDHRNILNNFVEKAKHQDKLEFMNSLIHGLAAVFSLVALAAMVVFASMEQSTWKIVSCAIYGATMFILFLSSTLYHAFKQPKVKEFFHILDHSAIFLLIAGTYTPFLLATNLRGPFGWSLFGVIWGFAVVGIVIKAFFTGKFKVLSTMIYLLMGWIIVLAMKRLWYAIEPAGFFWLVAGGLLYTLGTIFYLNRKLKYHHAIWHIFVFFASVCQFISVMFYVIL